MKTINIDFIVRLPFSIKNKGKYFLSSCNILDIHSQGYTKDKAIKNLEEALSLFFLSCLERGTLDAVLKQCGFVPSVHTQKQSKTKLKKYIDVPIPMIVNEQKNNLCHA